MRFIVLVCVCLIQLLYVSSSYANFAAWDKPIAEYPATQWLVKESTNFTITYPKASAAMADKALNIAERVHLELLPFFSQGPKEKTTIVLVDDFDSSNGWATFYPYPQIRLFSSPPDSISGLEVNDDWLHSLIRHEYVHILHLEMARGTPETLRHVFGRVPLFFPHAITPSFMLEGLATYLETNQELGYGRLQGSYYAMQMRTEVAEQRLKSLGDVSAPLRHLPFGMQYLYGSYFVQYLTQTYGEEAVKLYLHTYSAQILPAIMQNNTLEKVIGKRFDDVWLEYHYWLNQKFSGEINALNSSLLQGEPLSFQSEKGSYNALDQGIFKDVVSSNGSEFYFIHNNAEDTPELRTYSLLKSFKAALSKDIQQDLNIETKNIETKSVTSLDVNDKKDIVISRKISWSDGRTWADLFLLTDGIFGQQWEAITYKSRLRNVRWLNNDLMIASRKINGISEFIILDKQGNMNTLWRGEDETTVIGDFDIKKIAEDINSSSPITYVIAAVKRAKQGWNLERIDLHKTPQATDIINAYEIGQWQPITDTKAVENSPQILDDGRILFSADYDGIYNIFMLDPVTEQLTQLTNMLTGAFEPKLIRHQDKQVVIFQAYTADGFEFRQLDFTNTQSQSKQFHLSDKQGRYNYPEPFTINVDKTEPESYSPWASLMPRWWLPYYTVIPEATHIGIMTGGTDALTRHNYSLSLGVDWENELADIGLFYSYDNRYQLSFNRSHDYLDFNKDNDPDLIVEKDNWTFARNHIVNALEDQLSLNMGMVVEREGALDRDDLLSASCRTNLNSSGRICEKTLVGLGLKYDSREGYLNSPGFSSGRYIDLVYEHNEVFSGLLDSDYQGGILQGQWQEVFDLPGRRSLSFQIIAAQGNKNSDAITVGGDNRFTELSLFGRDEYALRGYGSSVQAGNNVNVNRINYNQWLARIDKGWGIWPIGAGDLSTDLYVDYGSAWQDSGSANYLTGIGIDFKLEVLAFYNVMMPIKLSFARGLDSELGEDRVGLGVSLPY